MHAGKPQAQALAIAYSVKHKAKPKKMANGGYTINHQADREKEGMSVMGSKVRGINADKSDPKDDAKHILSGMKKTNPPKLKGLAEGGMAKTTRIDQPRMTESSVIKPKKRGEINEVLSMHEAEEDREPMLAKGGPVPLKQRIQRSRPDQGTSRTGHTVRSANAANDWSKSPISSDPSFEAALGKDRTEEAKERAAESLFAEHDRPHPKLKGLAEGGMAEQEEDHHDSITAAIMAKRNRLHDMIDSGAMDEDHAAEAMAEGGEVDLSINADEEPNHEDQLSFEALKKENYSESPALDDLDQPSDSNEEGDDREDERSDKHDRVSSIMSKMKKKRA